MRANVHPGARSHESRTARPPSRRWAPRLLLAVAFIAPTLSAQAPASVTTPKQHFGFNIGDDYKLATYDQFTAYWRKIDQESDRIVVQEIGKTAEGRPQLMAIITSPENHRNLARYKDIARRLALAEGISEEEARRLSQEGKAVVWFDGGLHATEVLGASQLIETTFQLASRNDPETTRFLNDLIILAVHANPDGMELVSNWYMREADSTKRSTGGIPRLYQKYIGHDNNRDFYLGAQPETENILRVQFHEWFPQIVYNHHQTGPAGAVLFAPPFRDPHNHNFDPLIPLGIDLVGASMHNRFAVEGKPGAVRREGAGYQTWWNGGLRTTTYFHNMIGLLTETIGNPTPMEIPFTPQKLISTGDYPYPITPQKWHFRQSVDYSVTANYAVFDVASRHREQFLYNIYKMGRNSIERGNTDTWTIYPRYIAAVQDSMAKERAQTEQGNARLAAMGGFSGVAPTKFFGMLRDPKLRDPRGYIITADQPDFLTATKFVNALIKNGVAVHRASREFTAAGKRYPAGSYVVKSAQAFRPHVLDMFEPQDYPNDLQYPGGPPKAPYDNAGYTLAYQMGVQFDRMLDAFDGPFEKIDGFAKAPAGNVARGSGANGYLLSHATNDAFIALNRLMKNQDEVYWYRNAFTANGKSYPAGTYYIASKSGTLPVLQKLAQEKGLDFEGVSARPAGDAFRVRPTRVALWDTYGGSMPSGWTRWIFEQYELPFQVVYPQQLDAGNLASKYDVIVFVDGAIPASDQPQGGGGGGGFGGRQPDPASIPAEFRGWLGRVSVAKTVPQLKKFMEDGGTVITIGSSNNLAYHLDLPVQNHLVEHTANGSVRDLPREKFFAPGSVLRAAVDVSHPLAHGIPSQVDVFYDNSPVFRLAPSAAVKGVRPVAWFDSAKPLRSGWAWGQQYLESGVAVAEAEVGRGRLLMMGPEVVNRAQPHGTFKFLFNGIYYGPSGGSRTRTGEVRADAQQ